MAIFVKFPALKEAVAFTATICSIFFPSKFTTVNEFGTDGGLVVG